MSLIAVEGMNMAEREITPREAAVRLGCSLDFVYRQLWTGRIPGAKKVFGHWTIPTEAVEARLEARKRAK